MSHLSPDPYIWGIHFTYIYIYIQICIYIYYTTKFMAHLSIAWDWLTPRLQVARGAVVRALGTSPIG